MSSPATAATAAPPDIYERHTPEQVVAWRDALFVTVGAVHISTPSWGVEATYANHEDIMRAATFKSDDGWTVTTVVRPADERYPRGYYSIHAWGPDGAAVVVPEWPDIDQMMANLHRCPQCGATGDAVRIAFANRACKACAPAVAAAVCRGNWTA